MHIKPPIYLRFFLWILLVFGVNLHTAAQQDKMFTQYLNYPSALNPAYAGSRGAMQFLGITRRQWLGVEGAPESSVFSINTPVNFFNLGLGLTFETDKLGSERTTDMGLDLSYRIQVGYKTFLNLGLKAGVAYYKLDLTRLRFRDPSDPWSQHVVKGDLIPNFGAGIYLYNQKFFTGFSVPRILQTNVSSGDLSESRLERDKMHYYLISGYIFDLNPFLKFRPSTLIKATQGSRLSWDVSGIFILFDRLWLGASYRDEDSVAAIFQCNIQNHFRIGYSYDFAVSRLSGRSQGSHEIALSYDLVFKSKKLKSPRYF